MDVACRAAAFGASLLAPVLATYCAALPLAVAALRRAPGGTLPAKKLLRCIQVRCPGSCVPVTDTQHRAACWLRLTLHRFCQMANGLTAWQLWGRWALMERQIVLPLLKNLEQCRDA